MTVNNPAAHPLPAAALAMPHKVRLGANLTGLLFPLMKLLPAFRLVEAAAPGCGIIETSSGTMALALGMVCAAAGRPVTLVTPPLEASLERHLRSFGQTTLVTVADRDEPGGNQAARLRVLQSILSNQPSLVWTRQYENPLVPASYEPVGQLVAEAGIDCVVASVGSGGSAQGIARGLRRHRPYARLIGVDPGNSVLFGRPDGPRTFPGMGNSILPGLLDRATFDEVHWLSDRIIAQVTRDASREMGLLLGPSGGAALHVARWWARLNPAVHVACVLPEMGHRYLDTLYASEGQPAVLDDAFSKAPVQVAAPTIGFCDWEVMQLPRFPLRFSRAAWQDAS